MSSVEGQGRNCGEAMGRLRSFAARFAADRSGATAIEYGLICGLIFLAIVAAVTDVATSTVGLHTKIQTSLN
jgi:pilus assembly protein Flp/PilA